MAMASLILNLYQFYSNRGRFAFRVGIGHAVKESGEGTFFALKLSIYNVGRASIYFNGLKAIKIDEDYYFPSYTVSGGTRIESGDSVVGSIPAGHMLKDDVRDLFVLDGLWNSYRVPRRKLKRALQELRNEANRLESLGYSLIGNLHGAQRDWVTLRFTQHVSSALGFRRNDGCERS